MKRIMIGLLSVMMFLTVVGCASKTKENEVVEDNIQEVEDNDEEDYDDAAEYYEEDYEDDFEDYEDDYDEDYDEESSFID